MDFLIAIYIIYIIYKKFVNKSNGLLSINLAMERLGYTNIKLLEQTTTSKYYSAIKKGDNYLILQINKPSTSVVNSLAVKMRNKHYHYGVIASTFNVDEATKRYGEKYCIEFVNILNIKNLNENVQAKLEEFKNYKENNIRKTNDELIQSNYEDNGPIKSFKKSSLLDFFKKPDRL